jgi:hypothetical protein
VTIVGSVPANEFPVGCSGVGCSSEVPAFFTGFATLHEESGAQTLEAVLPMALESAYLNPVGAPIVFASTDPSQSVFIVTGYNDATILWAGVKVQGTFAGTLGSSNVAGNFNETTLASENLVAGTETELGTIGFHGSTTSQVIDVHGLYQGHSSIPAPGPYSDCSGETTGVPGTCTLTGLLSGGSFFLTGAQGMRMSGGYSINWDTPAISFCSPSPYVMTGGPCTVTATVNP